MGGGNRGVCHGLPNEDEDVSLNRDLCFKKLFNNPDDLKRVF